MDTSENPLSSQNPEQVTVPNCFEPGNHVKSSDDGEIDHNVIGDLESVDLNETSNDSLERNSPNLTDATDSASTSMTDSPTSIPSGSQTSKKKR